MEMHRWKHAAQVGKYLTTGLITNSVCYLSYVLLTVAGMGHKSAMSMLFVAAVMMSYHMNQRWTFSCLHSKARFRYYASAYSAAYLLNLLSLWVAVDRMGLSHYWVQAVNMVILATLLFITQKYWIFVALAENG